MGCGGDGVKTQINDPFTKRLLFYVYQFSVLLRPPPCTAVTFIMRQPLPQTSLSSLDLYTRTLTFRVSRQ